MIILLVLPTVMADAYPLMLEFDGACDDSECNLEPLFKWAEDEYGVENIEMITVDVSDFEGLTVSGFGATGDRIQYGPTTLAELNGAGFSTIQFRVEADIDIDGWNGDLDSIIPATFDFTALPSVTVNLDAGGTEITDTGYFYSLAPEGYIQQPLFLVFKL